MKNQFYAFSVNHVSKTEFATETKSISVDASPGKTEQKSMKQFELTHGG